MILKEITISKSQKVGLPDYSSAGVTVSVTYEVAEGEKPDLDKGWKAIDSHIKKQLNQYIRD